MMWCRPSKLCMSPSGTLHFECAGTIFSIRLNYERSWMNTNNLTLVLAKSHFKGHLTRIVRFVKHSRKSLFSPMDLVGMSLISNN